MEILVHDVPVEELPPVAARDGADAAGRGVGQVARGEPGHPGGLGGGVLPEDVVAADGDAVGPGEPHEGVGDGVVLGAAGALGGVPLELVLEDGVAEAGGEPVLVSGVSEDVLVDGAAQGEVGLAETY